MIVFFGGSIINFFECSVKWFNSVKGYGFITPAAGGKDVFVHRNQIYSSGTQSLAEGEDVVYEVAVDESGRATAVSSSTLTNIGFSFASASAPPKKK